MKTVKDIDDKVTHFQDDLAPDGLAQLPTFRKMFRAAVGMGIAKDGENAIDLVQLGLKLRVEGSELPLEDAEFKLLKQRCSENPAQWLTHFHGQVMLKLRDAEERKNG